MHLFSRPVLVALVVAVAMVILVAASAPGNELSTSSRQFTLRWEAESEPMGIDLFHEDFGECEIILAGEFHDTYIVKSSAVPLGQIDLITIETCPEWFVVESADLPWHIEYGSFAGTLPAIDAIRLLLLDAVMLVDLGEFRCGLRTELSNAIYLEAVREAGGALTGATLDSDTGISMYDLPLSAACFLMEPMRLAGTASVEDGAMSDVDITLIDDPPARLTASPERLTVTGEPVSGSFAVTNIGRGSATATITRASDEGAEEFDVSGPGCTAVADGASCVFTIAVNERPLASGRVTIYYRDGVGGERTVSIPVTISGSDPTLTANPSEVRVGATEYSDIATVRNGSEGGPITVTRVVVESSDAERPDFSVSAPGCPATIGPNESCTYVVSGNDRPEDDGRFTIHYRGSTGGEAAMSVSVDITGEDPQPAVLSATPASVAVDALENNGSFVLRNTGSGVSSAEITRTVVEAADRERPEFEVVGFGCGMLIFDATSCTYTVIVNERPQREGYVTFFYRDGIGGEATTRVRVDIA
jgi:hypothetical protein